MTWEEAKGGRWDQEKFFQTGVGDIHRYFESFFLSCHPNLKRGVALDFGCGVGRLTRPLSQHFEICIGVDISSTMVERANALKQQEKQIFLLNQREDLGMFASGSFDLVFTLIVLQHMEPDLHQAYLREFARILRPGGGLLFQLPAHIEGQDLAKPDLFGEPRMEMYGTNPDEVVQLLESSGVKDLAVEEKDAAGDTIKSHHYAALKQ